jgi:hypothetical protein
MRRCGSVKGFAFLKYRVWARVFEKTRVSANWQAYVSQTAFLKTRTDQKRAFLNTRKV